MQGDANAVEPPPGLHVLPVAVGWGHCDPAGIVYFPRFFEMFHAAMETWFDARLAMPYAEVIGVRKLGFPSVHTEADFRRPTRFGETVDVELRVVRVGTSSIEFAYVIRGRDGTDDVRATGKTVCVVMDLDPARASYRRSVPLPPDLRDRIAGFGVG